MSTSETTTPARKSKMFWVLEDTGVRYLKCWDCPPNKDMWWCPQAGFSGSRKHHFFYSEKIALEKHINNLTREKAEVEILLNKAVRRLNTL